MSYSRHCVYFVQSFLLSDKFIIALWFNFFKGTDIFKGTDSASTDKSAWAANGLVKKNMSNSFESRFASDLSLKGMYNYLIEVYEALFQVGVTKIGICDFVLDRL